MSKHLSPIFAILTAASIPTVPISAVAISAVAISTLTVPTKAQDAKDAAAQRKKAQRKKEKKPTDRALVHAAMLDYVEGIYDVQPDRIARTVARDLDKVGIVIGTDKKRHTPVMTYEALHNLAASYNKGGKRVPKDAPKKVEILEVLPHIAIAKLTAAWGIDYIQMAKSEKGWQIKQITWQRPEKDVETADEDRAAIQKAAEGYVRAFYEVKPELIEKHVDPKLAKFGNYNGKWSGMTYDQLRSLASRAFKENPAPKNAPKKVEILDCANETAVVKLTAAWGIDLMNITRTDKGWKVRQVIWQSHPAEK